MYSFDQTFQIQNLKFFQNFEKKNKETEKSDLSF